MNDIVAFIVGIESYKQPGWDVTGPYRKALEAAKYALAIGAKPKNIFLFANQQSGQESSAAEAELAALGIRPRIPIRDDIDTCFNELPDGCPNDLRLFCFWSGHGYTNAGDRIFVCMDYESPAFIGRIFNGTNRLLRLRSARFRCFSEQLFVADVCAKYATVKLGVDLEDVDNQSQPIKQVAFFATPEGKFSTGAFSTIALAHLLSVSGWPDLDALGDGLRQALKQDPKLEPHQVSFFGRNAAITDEPFGQRRVDDVIYRVHALLSQLALSLPRFHTHYAATVKNLGLAEAQNAVTLWGMILDFVRLQDRTSEGMSYGLLQFLVRIGRDPAAGSAVGDWLDDNLQPNQADDRKVIDEIVLAERANKILVFEVDNNSAGNPNRLAWSLGSHMQKAPSSALAIPHEIKTWEHLCERVVDVVEGLEGQGNDIAEIHFAVDPPLFNRDFHRIPRDQVPQAGGQPRRLGELYVVLLRHCTRTSRPVLSLLRQKSEQRAAELHRTPLKEIKCIRIPPGPSDLERLFKRGGGLCYAGFVFGSPTDALRNERDVITRLVATMGVPYLCWLQDAPEQDWIKKFDKRLKLWLRGGAELRDFPATLKDKRAAGDRLASFAGLLWDDPRFVPLTAKRAPKPG